MTEDLGGRPPLRTEQIVTALDRHGVDYVLIGGLAAVVHGSAVATTDLDLVPAGNRSNLGRLAGALRELEAKMRVPDLATCRSTITPSTPCTGASFRTPYGDVDVVSRPDAPGPRRHFTFDELNSRAHPRRAFGVTIRSPISTTSSARRRRRGGRRIWPPCPIWPRCAPHATT